jgi:hypothetical protein
MFVGLTDVLAMQRRKVLGHPLVVFVLALVMGVKLLVQPLDAVLDRT